MACNPSDNMTNASHLTSDLADIAPYMTALRKDDAATVRYELLSGSLVWSDEIPRDSPVSKDCLRFVLRHRTGLIVGEESPPHGDLWREAVARFPQWIGFSPERVSPNDMLAKYYHAERERVFRELRADEDSNPVKGEGVIQDNSL